MKQPRRPKKATSSGRKRPQRVKLSPEESLRRMEEFPEREAAFIAAIRDEVKIEPPRRAKLTREEIKKRMAEFPARRKAFIAAIRKKGRSSSSSRKHNVAN